MRGAVAKRIRKEIYGEQSPKVKTYNLVARWIERTILGGFMGGKDHAPIHERFFGYDATLTATGLRRAYKDAKRVYSRRLVRE